MKKILLLLSIITGFAIHGSAQSCTPSAPTGSPGVTPPTENLACAVFGQPYAETIFVENFSSFSLAFGSGTVDSLRIDSITNRPCGLSYQVNPDNTLNTGQTACIQVYGTSYERPGQYHLGIYLTVWYTVTTPLGSTSSSMSGRADSLVAQIETLTGSPTGIDFDYWLRVKDQAAICPDIDTTGAIDSIASVNCPPPGQFVVDITGASPVCTGTTTTLTANIIGTTTGVITYLWSTGSDSATAVVTSPATASVTVTASSVSAADTFIVVGLNAPVANLSATASGGMATLTNTSTGTITSSSVYVPGVDTLNGNATTVVFGASGSYDIILEVSNACGTSRDTATVAVTVVAGSCTPLSPLGAPGITPPAVDIPCASIGVPYDTTIFIENLTTYSATISGIPVTIQMDSLVVTNITNLPCGIDWSMSPSNNKLLAGQTGCINLSGTTSNVPGQYKLGIYIHIYVEVAGFGALDFEGKADSLLGVLQSQGVNLPINFDYWIRVNNSGNPCPALDQTGASDGVATSAPVASFNTTSSTLTATFTSTSSGAPTNVTYYVNGDTLTGNISTYEFDSAGTYEVIIEASNSCSTSRDTQNVTVTSVGINSINNNGATISVYPNPNNGNMQLLVNSAVANENYTVRIFNIQGKEVYNTAFSGNINTGINLDVAAGVYFLHVNSLNVSAVQKLIIK